MSASSLGGLGPVAGHLKKLRSAAFWRRRLQVDAARYEETKNLHNMKVHGGISKAISAAALAASITKAEAAAAWRESVVLVANDGESLPFLPIWESSVANPMVRFAELNARLSGIESVEKAAGADPFFLTLTLPPCWHRVHSRSWLPNELWSGASIRDAQQELMRMWGVIRSSASRVGIRLRGFRIAEPHHDGTPHLHALIFISPSDIAAVRGAITSSTRFWAAESSDWAAYGLRLIKIEGGAGSTCAYLAKYLKKGLAASNDEKTGQKKVSHAAAWAALWGIRQFQFFGYPAITPFRVLRSLPRIAVSGVIASMQMAAASGDYARYVNLVLSAPGSPPSWRAFDVVSSPYVSGVLTVRGEEIEKKRSKFSAIVPSPWYSYNNCTEVSNMAKVTGPLCSLDASGTFGRILSFQHRDTKPVVCALPTSIPKPSQAQEAQRSLVSVLYASWRGMSTELQESWKTRGRELGYPGTRLFFREWFLQGVEQGGLPVLP